MANVLVCALDHAERIVLVSGDANPPNRNVQANGRSVIPGLSLEATKGRSLVAWDVGRGEHHVWVSWLLGAVQ